MLPLECPSSFVSPILSPLSTPLFASLPVLVAQFGGNLIKKEKKQKKTIALCTFKLHKKKTFK